MAQPAKSFQVSKKKKPLPWLLIAFGLVFFFLITFFFSLLWSAALYLDSAEPGNGVALAIYLLALFLSCLAVSFISRSTSPWPVLILALLASLFSLIFAGFSGVNWLFFSLKTVAGLLIAFAAFMALVFWEKNKKTNSRRPTSSRF